MSNNATNHCEAEWRGIGAKIGAAIRVAFPVGPLAQEYLHNLIEDTCESTPDDELRNFLEMLRNFNWINVEWQYHWDVLPLLPKRVFDYCLPGIMYWLLTEKDAMQEVAEFLVEYHLAPLSDRGVFDFSSFNNAQQKVIADYLDCALCFLMTSNLDVQQRVQKVIDTLRRGVLGSPITAAESRPSFSDFPK